MPQDALFFDPNNVERTLEGVIKEATETQTKKEDFKPRSLDELNRELEGAWSNEIITEKSGSYYCPEKRIISERSAARFGVLEREIYDIVMYDLGGAFQISMFKDEQEVTRWELGDKGSAEQYFHDISKRMAEIVLEPTGIKVDIGEGDRIYTALASRSGILVGVYRDQWKDRLGPGAYVDVSISWKSAVELSIVDDDMQDIMSLNGWYPAMNRKGFYAILERLDKTEPHYHFDGDWIGKEVRVKRLADYEGLFGRKGLYSKRIYDGYHYGLMVEVRELEIFRGEYIYSVGIVDLDQGNRFEQQSFYHRIDPGRWEQDIPIARELALKSAIDYHNHTKTLRRELAQTADDEHEWCKRFAKGEIRYEKPRITDMDMGGIPFS